jgi:hypothetical protein
VAARPFLIAGEPQLARQTEPIAEWYR